MQLGTLAIGIPPHLARPVCMRTSLIVTTYNWPAALHATLTSIARQSVLPDEIIIADDGSGPATAGMVDAWRARLSTPLHHVWQEDLGFRLARCRNLAIRAARCDYLILIDGDMILQRRFIEDHRQCARPDCFIQGTRVQLSPAQSARLLHDASIAPSPWHRGLGRRHYAWRNRLASWLTSRTKWTLSGVQGCNQSFWRAHALQINGYDERFNRWGPEDREFAARLLHLGIARHHLRHRAVAYHLHHAQRANVLGAIQQDILDETLTNRRIVCAHGIMAHPVPPDAAVIPPTSMHTGSSSQGSSSQGSSSKDAS